MKVRDALAMAVDIAANRSSLPILAHVRITPGQCLATDTDQQVALPIDLPGDIGCEGFCVHAARLLRVLKVLPEGQDLELRVDDSSALHVAAGETRFKLNTLPAGDFPLMQESDDMPVTIAVDGKALAAALKFIKPAMAVKDIRYYLVGAHISFVPGAIVLVATDGHRLHRVRVPLDEYPDLDRAAGILSAASVPRIIDIAERHATIELSLSRSRLVVESNEVLHANLIEGQFPDVDRVIPRDQKITGSAPRSALADAIERVAQVFGGDVGGVRMSCSASGIALAARNADGEQGDTRLNWDIVDPAVSEYAAGFEWHYITEALRAFDGDTVYLHLPGSDSMSLYITDNDAGTREAVVMPWKL